MRRLPKRLGTRVLPCSLKIWCGTKLDTQKKRNVFCATVRFATRGRINRTPTMAPTRTNSRWIPRARYMNYEMAVKPMLRRLIPALIVLALFALSCATQRKRPAGITNGRLAPCPGRPNCVSSEDGAGSSRIEPLTFAGTPEGAWVSLKRAVQATGGTIEKEDNDYIRAIFRTRFFRFVDDVEFRMDAPNRSIHVRSASRVGYSDLGANRRRVEALRELFLKIQKQPADGSGEEDGVGRAVSSP